LKIEHSGEKVSQKIQNSNNELQASDQVLSTFLTFSVFYTLNISNETFLWNKAHFTDIGVVYLISGERS